MKAATGQNPNSVRPKLLAFSLLPLQVLFAGELSQRFELTLERVLEGDSPRYDQRFLLADVVPEDIRIFTNFSGDLSGRYLGALAATARHRDKARPNLAAFVSKLLGHQRADGHFGKEMGLFEIQDDDMARLWGNGRLLVGLLEYYQLEPRPEVPEAARRLGDFLISAARRFNAKTVRQHFSRGKLATGYICWTQNIEGLVELYRLTDHLPYLRLARQMAERTRRHPNQHSHGFLTSLRGILRLAEMTGERRYLSQVEREWRQIVDSDNLLVHGAIPEYFAPGIERDEGCSEADWLRLNLTLWRMTGDLTYLNHAERTLFNEFFMNQFPSGDFGHVKISPTGLGRGAERAWWCCTLHGLRAFSEIFASVFRAEGERTLFYDLPVDGWGRMEGLSVQAVSSLETEARVRLQVVESDGKRRTIAFRVPAWAEHLTVARDGEILAGEIHEGYLRVAEPWQSGESVSVDYSFRTRAIRDPRRPGHVALFLGPWLLAVSEEHSPAFFQDFSTLKTEPLATRDTQAGSLQNVPTSAEPASPFTIPAARRKLIFPTEDHTTPGSAILRPIAEHTSSDSTARWQFWFPVAGELELAATPPSELPEGISARYRSPALAAFLLLLGLAWFLRNRYRKRGSVRREPQ